MINKATIVYTLSDPINGEVRYVGKTVVCIKKRYNHHLDKARRKPTNHRDYWIRSLLNKGLFPVIEELEKTESDTETFWIEQFKCWGFNLTNMTSGGEGRASYKMPSDVKEKIRQSNVGQKRSMDFRLKMSKVKTGTKLTQKTKDIMSALRKGHPTSMSTRVKIALANGRKLVCYDLKGNFISEFNSQADCARKLNLSQPYISELMAKNKPYNEYIFKFKDQ